MIVLRYGFIILQAVVIAYLIGSIPTGYLIVKKLKGIDIRETGSGSTGATNVKRILGTKWFFIVMLIDALKGYLAVLIAIKFYNIFDILGLVPSLAGLAVIIGHSKSVFLKFTGGKSVATGVGTIFALNWPVGLIAAGIWAIVTFFSKFVSLGSIIAVAAATIWMAALSDNTFYIIYTAVCAVFVIFTHKDNIKRLLEGKENKVRK